MNFKIVLVDSDIPFITLGGEKGCGGVESPENANLIARNDDARTPRNRE